MTFTLNLNLTFSTLTVPNPRYGDEVDPEIWELVQRKLRNPNAQLTDDEVCVGKQTV